VRGAELALAAARLQRELAQSGALPQLEAYARVDHASTSGGSNLFPFGTRSDVASVGVQLRWALVTGGRVDADVDQAAQRLQQAEALRDAARDDAGHAARGAYLTLDADLARVASLGAALRSGDAALAANRLGYKVGMRSSSDVLDALARRSDAERDLDAARYAVLLDGLRLRQAAGSLRDADLQAVDALLQR
jgi:outer membrane protein